MSRFGVLTAGLLLFAACDDEEKAAMAGKIDALDARVAELERKGTDSGKALESLAPLPNALEQAQQSLATMKAEQATLVARLARAAYPGSPEQDPPVVELWMRPNALLERSNAALGGSLTADLRERERGPIRFRRWARRARGGCCLGMIVRGRFRTTGRNGDGPCCDETSELGRRIARAERHGEATRELVSRIKILGGLDIAERRRPQDGSFRVHIERDGQVRPIDLRISIVPSYYGESVVLRVLDRSRVPTSIAC